jgi:hypothetical protein
VDVSSDCVDVGVSAATPPAGADSRVATSATAAIPTTSNAAAIFAPRPKPPVDSDPAVEEVAIEAVDAVGDEEVA